MTGVDASTVMLAEARARAAATGLPVAFRHGDAGAGFTGITLDATFVESDYPFLRRLLAPALRQLAVSGAVSAAVLGRWQQVLAAAWDDGHYTGGAVVVTAAALR